MRSLFVCNTPYQLFNVMNLALNDVQGTRLVSDLFIVARFRDAKKVYDRVIAEHTFESVYLIDPQSGDTFIKECRDSILISLEKKIKKYQIDSYDFLEKKYDQVFIADEMPFGLLMCQFYKSASVWIYEDGYPYYYKNFWQDLCRGRKQKILSLFNRGLSTIHPKGFFVNNAEMCQSKVAEKTIQLPKWNDQNPAFPAVCRLFAFNAQSMVSQKKVIFLERPFEEYPKYNGLSPEELLMNLGVAKDSLVRIHPRSGRRYNEVLVDYGENMWELECLSNITSDHILIGDCSNAQFSPKILANKEPYLIFAYRLFYNYHDSEDPNNYEKQIDQIRKAYSRKDKIFIPKNVEELRIALTWILTKGSDEIID